MSKYDSYQSPLEGRYSSEEMKEIFSARRRASTWRQLWLYLAEAQKELGLSQISDGALNDLRSNLVVSDAAFKAIAEEENKTRHDVMSHVAVFTYVITVPTAASLKLLKKSEHDTQVTDNADLIFIRDALDLVLPKLAKTIDNLSQFAAKYKDLPTLSYTHYQPAIPMTLGKRACQWIEELLMDLEDIEHVRSNLLFRGAQGTTGTQASFLQLFHGDASKVDKLNEILCKKAGFKGCYAISTQTYTRKVDLRVANALSAFGATAIRIATDIRHGAHDKILDEPRQSTQIGSSAMAFKMNPMRSERICSLGRKLSNLSKNFSDTFSNQWLERTLDDSAIRRIDIPEMFLLTDAILTLLDNVTSGIVVFEPIIKARLAEELPFMATENILMRLVELGVSRQEGHERIRVLSFETVDVIKKQGGKNDLMERIKKDEYFKQIWSELDALVDPNLFIGRCVDIVERYVGPGGPVEASLKNYSEHIATAATSTLAV